MAYGSIQVKLPFPVRHFIDNVEDVTYVLPRPFSDNVIFGGSYEPGVASTEVDKQRCECT
jgi:hypothetical protein